MNKRIFSVVLALLLMLSTFTAIAEVTPDNGKWGDLKWSINKAGVLSISSVLGNAPVEMLDLIAENEQNEDNGRSWKDYMPYISEVYLDGNITSIGANAFKDCVVLSVVEMPDSITKIGEGAFYGCNSLSEISLAPALTSIGKDAFYGCGKLAEVEFPSSVTTIGENAFYNCNAIETITITENITSIGKYAFLNCASLKTISVDGNNSKYKAVDNVLSNKEGTEIIFNAPASEKEEYIIPAEVTTIAPHAFDGSGSIKKVTMGEGVTKVYEKAFDNCIALNEVNYLGTEDSFYAIDGYQNIPNATVKCRSVVEGKWGENDNAIFVLENDGTLKIKGSGEMFAFENAEATPWYKYKDRIKSVIFESGVYSISDYAFENFTTIENITFAVGNAKIGKNAFYGCTALSKILLPKSITLIGKNAFANCTALFEITVDKDCGAYTSENNILYSKDMSEIILYPAASDTKVFVMSNKVKKVSGKAFAFASNLNEITFSRNIEFVEDYAFEGCEFEKVSYISEYGWKKVKIGENGNDAIKNEEIINFDYPYAGNCGNDLYWALDDEGTLTVYGTGEMTDYTSFDKTPWYDCADKIKKVVIENGVTSIGSYAFADCENLNEVQLGMNLALVNPNAFKNCRKKGNGKLYIYTMSLYKALNVKEGNDFLSELSIVDEVRGYGYCGDGNSPTLTWTVEYSGVLKIEGAGNMAEYEEITEVPWYEYRDSITEVNIGKDIEKLAMYALAGCDKITTIKTAPESETFTFADGVLYNKDKTEIIKYLNVNSASEYKVPVDVTSIAAGAFYGNKTIKFMVFDTTNGAVQKLEKVGKCAFENVAIENVRYAGKKSQWENIDIHQIGNDCLKNAELECFPGGEETDGINWFITFDNVLTISGENISMSDYEYTGKVAPWKKYAAKIEKVIIEDGVTSIGKTAFHGCNALDEVIIAGTVTTIKSDAFCECDKIKSITLSENVNTIEDGAFDNCVSLAEINVDANNQNFKSVNGILYSKDETKLIQYPTGKDDLSYSMPNTVSEISASAFSYNTSLASVTISSEIAELKERTFKKCTGIRSITIPATVNTIEAECFDDCNITDVYYTGTEASWSEINIYKANKCILEANIHYVAPIHIRAIVDKNTDGDTFNVAPVGAEIGDRVFISLYCNKKLVDLDVTNYNGEDITFKSAEIYDTAKVVVWTWYGVEGEPGTIESVADVVEIK